MTSKIEIRVNDEFKTQVTQAADAAGMSKSDVVRHLLELWLFCGAPALGVSAQQSFPDLQQLVKMVQTLGRTTIELHQILVQLQHNELLNIPDSLLQTLDVNLQFSQDDSVASKPMQSQDDINNTKF